MTQFRYKAIYSISGGQMEVYLNEHFAEGWQFVHGFNNIVVLKIEIKTNLTHEEKI
jgi:hypothetical protein